MRRRRKKRNKEKETEISLSLSLLQENFSEKGNLSIDSSASPDDNASGSLFVPHCCCCRCMARLDDGCCFVFSLLILSKQLAVYSFFFVQIHRSVYMYISSDSFFEYRSWLARRGQTCRSVHSPGKSTRSSTLPFFIHQTGPSLHIDRLPLLTALLCTRLGYVCCWSI